MMSRLKAMMQLDRKRLDAALMRIHGRPVLMVAFNSILLGINSLGRAKQGVKTVLGKLGVIDAGSLTSAANLMDLPQAFRHRVFGKRPSVLIVCETSIPQCFRYRVLQKIEQLTLLDRRCHWVDWTNYMEVSNQIAFHDVIIFYRVPGYPKMMANIEYAKRLGKVVIYDTDDLIFDRQILESYYQESTGQLSAKDLKGVLKGAVLYKQAIAACRFAITTTPALQQQLENVLGEGFVYILPNGLDEHSLPATSQIRPVKETGKLTLFYGSGTKTHDKDFALIARPLAKLMDKYQHVQLVLVGYLSPPPELDAYESRITRIGLLGVDEYLRVLSHADINLAPLCPGLFADCKSEIKWLEAGALGVPTVASATRVYRDAIIHGQDGLVAENDGQWLEMLDSLVSDEQLRIQIGQAAAASARQTYSTRAQSDNFSALLGNAVRTHITENDFRFEADGRRHIVIVNVLYPPQAMGGATVVAQNIVRTLADKYSDQFRVSVFTCDINNIFAYQVSEYEYDGIAVTAVSVPVGPDVDYRGYDAHVGELFAEYLAFAQPDLVHFHSIQRLTAALLDACLEKQIPYIVTVHDAWWVSDHQFLVDASGAPVAQPQANPIVAARTSTNVQQTVERSARLIRLLSRAQQVLAVSEYQARFYCDNGVDNVMVNANGVNPLTGTQRRGADERHVVLGYCGSICHHKGYYFLKQILESGSFQHLKLKVIQFNLAEARSETWNTIDVEFIPKLESENMGEFYAAIDVLIAPAMWPESFGLITREAALAGVWVVAAEAGGLAEVIEQDKNGFSYPIGDVEKLSDILRQIDNNPARYQQRVDAGQVATIKINVVDQQVAELVNVYNSAPGRPSDTS